MCTVGLALWKIELEREKHTEREGWRERAREIGREGGMEAYRGEGGGGGRERETERDDESSEGRREKERQTGRQAGMHRGRDGAREKEGERGKDLSHAEVKHFKGRWMRNEHVYVPKVDCRGSIISFQKWPRFEVQMCELTAFLGRITDRMRK